MYWRPAISFSPVSKGNDEYERQKAYLGEIWGICNEKTVIQFARSYGSGGRTLGKLLAEELGINCYDSEILRMASDDSGINEALFGQTDEKLKKSPLFRIARKNPYKGGVIPPESADFVSDDNLFNYQAKVIRELAEEESCIIIGRCADYVLKDDPNVLRLFFFAPKEDCIVRVMEHDGITGRDAENKIEKIDKHRADYYKYYTGKDWMMRETMISVWIRLPWDMKSWWRL